MMDESQGSSVSHIQILHKISSPCDYFYIIYYSLHQDFTLSYGPYFHSWLILLVIFPVPIIRG